MKVNSLGSIVFLTTTLIAQQPPNVQKLPKAASHNSTGLMTAQQFLALPSKPADARFSYGEDPNQFGELRVPTARGLHPVVILIHGGCWVAAYGSLHANSPMADALKAKGIATWNLEYRRLPQPGNGWPGTYLDVATGVDYLRSIAAANRLDLTRVVVLGHSAGGHLAMWLAARSRLARSSSLYTEHPLPLRGVIDLAGTPDMQAFFPLEQVCGAPVVEQILGGTPASVPERYARSSAITMLTLGIPQVLVWGVKDEVVPISIGERYTQKPSWQAIRLPF